MLVDHQKSSPLLWFKPSSRTWPEQAVGAALFLLISLAFEWLTSWLIRNGSEVGSGVFGSHWIFKTALSAPLWILYQCLSAFAMWNLWRRYSLHFLKLEFALFLFQLVLQAGWAVAFFIYHESLLALITLLFLCTSTILAALLYWKRERFSGQALIPSFFWIFYVMGVNMAICIVNP